MELQQRIDADIRTAMLARDKDRLNALRAIKSAILLELTKEGAQGGLDEAVGMRILQKLHKQRQESAAIYHEQGRTDLAAEEEVQAAVIEAYLPQRLSEAEVEAAVKQVIALGGAAGMKDMGRVMGLANKELAGKADGALIAALVKRLLTANG
ncbi:MAG: GatB/YqeY domain-containing protein [Flavobacteriales bacterium]|nr:GatB/YqeY domain-containing protein [Flavobacteriales bacterium]